jgi:arylsulfatase A-like enzyme
MPLGAALLALGAGSAVHAAPGSEKPNIIFILADDLGYMDVGCYNPRTFYETPNIDALAGRGLRFTQGYAACAVCSPTRGSILTGKYPPRFGITDFIPGAASGRLKSAPNAHHLPLEEVTLAEALREGGYETFFAGKWHLGGGEYYPGAQGFPADLTGGPAQKEGAQFFYPKSGVPVPDYRDDPKTTDRIADEAAAFIRAHADRPFFAYLPFLAVHLPLGARADLVAKYQEKAKRAPADAFAPERGSQVLLVQNNPVYAAMLEQLDTAVGRVIAAVEQAGLTRKTVVVFMSDNGGLSSKKNAPTSNFPLRAGKGWPYEGGVREPLIVVAPGITTAGATCDTPVISTDFYPTLLQLAGLDLRPQQHRDGVSFLPLLQGKTLPGDRPLFWHYPHYHGAGAAPHGAMREGDWKLVEWFEDGALELYNLRQDLGEQHDLAARQPEKVKALHAKLVAWRKEVGALMPVPNPDFDPNQKSGPGAPKKARKAKSP